VILTRSFDNLYEKNLAKLFILVGITSNKIYWIRKKGRQGDIAEGATKNVASSAIL
jgi:hypothetical protein